MKKKLSSLHPDLTIFKIFISIVLISTVVSMLLFLIIFLGTATIMSNDGDIFPNNPKGILERISEHFIVTSNANVPVSYAGDSDDTSATIPDNAINDGYSGAQISYAADDNDTGIQVSCVLTDETLLPDDYWCILINENGDIIWSLHKPADIPDHYSLNDIAQLTRWFLNDYPVYVRTEDYGLFVLGIPKNTVGKYSIEYTMEWFDTLPLRILYVFIMTFTISILLCSIFGSFLYKKIRLLTEGLVMLRREEAVSLPARGIFKEPFSNINRTSQALARKNALLASRDRARSNWISGISHDIRTPLSMVVGYGGQLAENPALSEENRNCASIITAQGLRIKKLIEDLNLISSLEYEMQPVNKQALQIAVLLRSVVTEILNAHIPGEQNVQILSASPLEEPKADSGSTDSTHTCSVPVSPSQNPQSSPEISLSLTCGQAMVLGDESLLIRAFYNLLQNSITHNESACHITVTASTQAEYVLIIIADNGQGVPEKVLENLDTLPNTAHGFGLPMACKIIRAHGGTFHAENKDGFIVTIKLPLLTV